MVGYLLYVISRLQLTVLLDIVIPVMVAVRGVVIKTTDYCLNDIFDTVTGVFTDGYKTRQDGESCDICEYIVYT